MVGGKAACPTYQSSLENKLAAAESCLPNGPQHLALIIEGTGRLEPHIPGPAGEWRVCISAYPGTEVSAESLFIYDHPHCSVG